MKILVAVKRVVDANVKVRVNADKTGIELANVKMSMNPFDEIAIEEAVRLKEAGKADEIVLVSIGTAQAQETLRTGLAMGADRGLLIQTDTTVEPLAVAKLLKFAPERAALRLAAEFDESQEEADRDQAGGRLRHRYRAPAGGHRDERAAAAQGRDKAGLGRRTGGQATQRS
jgi:electron transfer flavoprotein beta subunit